MPSLVSKRIDYYPTESEIADLFKNMGWPSTPSNKFVRDYAALKRGNAEVDAAIDSLDGRVTIAEAEIVALDVRLTAAEAEIVAIDIRLTTAEGEISTLRIDLDAHIAAESAHGALGSIVGRLNFPIIDPNPLLSKAGVVFTALQVADAVPSAITPPAAVAAAPAAYAQTYAQSQTDAINALSTQLDQLKTDHNNAIAQINLLMANMRTAKQLEVP